MAKFSDGDAVRLVTPVIAGEVADVEYNKDAGVLQYLVNYADAEGETHQRWFLEDQLEATPVAAVAGGKTNGK